MFFIKKNTRFGKRKRQYVCYFQRTRETTKLINK